MNLLNTFTLKRALKGLKSKEFTSVALTEACLNQIELYDDTIRAFITVDKENALLKAQKADELISLKGESAFESQPLLGIPYAIKDNFSTKGLKTTASSKMLEDYVPPFDSTVVKRLNEAGAILLGKTNMDAFAHGSSTETSDFFTTKNPWNLKKTPGGSSGGSSAAIAADMCIFSIGSETAGSIRGPAAWCGCVGLKPTYGRVSRYGVVAMASSTDSPGPLTKTVEDAAIVLEVISGKDALDATSSFEPVQEYSHEMGNVDLRNITIGLPKSNFSIDLEPWVKESVLAAADKFKELGANVIEVDLLDPKYSIAVYTILQRSEVSSNLGRLDGIRYGNPRTHFGKEAKNRMMLGAYTLSSGYYDAYYSRAQKVRTKIVEDYKRVFNDVTVLLSPTMPCVAPNVGISKSSSIFGELVDLLNEPSSIAGIPGVSGTCGFHEGLPIGFQLVGEAFSEKMLLDLMHIYQNANSFYDDKATNYKPKTAAIKKDAKPKKKEKK